jgi:hypothetical protein
MGEPRESDARTRLCCHLIYARAPEGLSRADADRLFNEYIAQPHRGVVLHHDHFVDRPGAFAVLEITTSAQLAALSEPGPLDGWTVSAHPLRFSPDGPGFYIQADSTLRRFSHRSLEQAPPRTGRCHDYTLRPLLAGDPGRYD